MRRWVVLPPVLRQHSAVPVGQVQPTVVMGVVVLVAQQDQVFEVLWTSAVAYGQPGRFDIDLDNAGTPR